MRIATFTAALALLVSGCDFKVAIKMGAKELKGEGITFLVPHETSSSSQGTGGISYNGTAVKATTDGKTLVVNGLEYGALSVGDKVDLREAGHVLVNGAERTPLKR